MTAGRHPNLDGPASSLRVIARLDVDGRPWALLEVMTWTLAEIPPDVADAAVPGTWWFGRPVAPSPAADVGAAP